MEQTTREYTDAELLRAHALKYGEGLPWAEVATMVGAPGENAIRKAVFRARRRGVFDMAVRQAVAAGQPVPEIVGVPAEDEPDEEAVWQSMTRTWQRVKAREAARAQQRIDFSATDLPVCITYLADLHLGGSGVDYPQIDADIETIQGTTGMFAAVVGDVVDNFLFSWAMKIRMGTEHTIPDEWAAARRVLGKLGPHTLATLAGNHDKWTRNLAGIDYFREVAAEASPDALYDRDEIVFDLLVGGGASYRVKLRHIWQGSSIYNQTHAVERAVRFDCPDVDHGVAAHTHHAGLSRPFHVGGRMKMATQCGAYKRVDEYQREKGFYQSNEQAAQAVMYTPDGVIQAFQTLDLAAQHMAIYYGKREV